MSLIVALVRCDVSGERIVSIMYGFLRHVDPNESHTASHQRRRHSWYWPPWKPQMKRVYVLFCAGLPGFKKALRSVWTIKTADVFSVGRLQRKQKFVRLHSLCMLLRFTSVSEKLLALWRCCTPHDVASQAKCCGAIGWGCRLQAGRSQVRDQMRWMHFFSSPKCSSRKPLTPMCKQIMFMGSRAGQVRDAFNPIAICEPVV
jgi:hypothetical protein